MPQPPAHCHLIQPHSFQGLSLTFQIYENCMAIRPGCRLGVWTPPMTQYSVSPECCGPHVDIQHHASEWCLHWVYPDYYSTFGTWLLTPLTVIFYTLIMLSWAFNSKSSGPAMSIWLCLDGITTWHAMFKLHYNIIHTRDSSSHLYSSIQVYASKYIKLNTQLHLPCYNTSPIKGFHCTYLHCS